MNFQIIAAILHVLKSDGIIENPKKAFRAETKFFEGNNRKETLPQWHFSVYFASEEIKSMLNRLADELGLNRIWQDPNDDTPVQGRPPTPCVGSGMRIMNANDPNTKKILEECIKELLERPIEQIRNYVSFGNRLVSASTTVLP